MRARGLFAYYAEIGRVVSADELSAVMPEGRDAIRAAIRELRDLGYIIITKQQVNGQWRTYMKFSESARKLLSTDDRIFRRSIYR
jgi:biotin operon repressor